MILYVGIHVCTCACVGAHVCVCVIVGVHICVSLCVYVCWRCIYV